jgi:hypothetical protein
MTRSLHCNHLFKDRGREGRMNNEERLAAIIGIRVYPSWKKQMVEEAKERGQTLSEFLYECMEAGWNIVVKQEKNESVKQ